MSARTPGYRPTSVRMRYSKPLKTCESAATIPASCVAACTQRRRCIPSSPGPPCARSASAYRFLLLDDSRERVVLVALLRRVVPADLRPVVLDDFRPLVLADLRVRLPLV